MSRFLVRIIIADICILSIQATLLLYHPFHQQGNNSISNFLIHLIFTIKNDTILLLNFPLFIFVYYIYFFTHKIDDLTPRLFLLGILNFIILYCISWIEMLLLIAVDVRIQQVGCGLTPEQIQNQMEPEYTPQRKIHLYHCDHRGLPLTLIRSDGRTGWRAEYDEQGTILREDIPDNLQQLIRLPGQLRDKETGLYSP